MLGFAPMAMNFDPDVPDVGYQMIMASMRAEARGTVKITSSDPRTPPALRFRYLSTSADRRFWVDAVRLARDVLGQPAFAGFDGGETYPGPSVQTDGQIVGWVAGTAQSNMHPTSTCRLGVDDRSVLDPATMGVHGIAGLSVADASAMPYCPSTATHGTDDDARPEGGRPDPRQHPARTAAGGRPRSRLNQVARELPCRIETQGEVEGVR